MKKKIVWVVVSCLMVLSLIMASCGPAAEEEAEVVEEEEVGVKEAPQYGGTLRTVSAWPYGAWDPTLAPDIRVGHIMFTHNEYIQGDWTKGLNGTGETAWEIGFLGRYDLLTGELAESWEMPDDETIVLHLRKGVHYHDKPPVNGRELTAEDAAWSIDMRFTYPGTWHYMSYPPESGKAPTSVKALDRYTVEIKVPAVSREIMLLEITENQYCNAPEIWIGEGPGEGKGMQDWEDVVGTGPFILTDYVDGSYATYEKFDNYFEYDPLYPENQWPYLDSFVHLFIPDLSTRLAALRTGRIDFLTGIAYDDALLLMTSYRDLQWSRAIAPWFNYVGMRFDRPELPFADLKVRQAMNLAVNQQEILDDYYRGQAVMLGYPFAPTKTYEPYYTPLEEMPEDVQMLYTYNPEKARELLVEAGYPDGFKTTITCTAIQVDELSIIKEYLADVGIDMELGVVEGGAFQGLQNSREYELIFAMAGIWAPFEMLNTKLGMSLCVRNTPDTYYDKVAEDIGTYIISDPAKYIQSVKEAGIYELASAWGIWTPRPWQYNMWWPWVKDYNGIFWTGWAGVWDWTKSIWVDEELKESMGY